MEIRRQSFGPLLDRIMKLLAAGAATAEDLAERLGDQVPGEDPAGLVDEVLMSYPPVGWHPAGFYRPDVIFTGITFTRVLTAGELAAEAIDIGDLPVVDQLPEDHLAAVGLWLELVDDHGPLVLRGPGGWLAGYQAGEVCSFGFDGERLRFGRCADVPDIASRAGMVKGLRAAFDRLKGRDGTAEIDFVVVDALLDDPEPWQCHLPPFHAIIEAAGLTRFGGLVAEHGFDWGAFRAKGAMLRLTIAHHLHRVQEAGLIEVESSFRAYQLAGEAELDRTAGRETVGAAVASVLCEGEVAPAAFDLLGAVLRVPAGEVRPFAAAVADRATHEGDRVGPLWLIARCDLETGDATRAERALRQVSALAPAYRPAIRELGWLAFERSRFADAHRLLREETAGGDEIRKLIEGLARPGLSRVGRNQQCPCGSGRKFKRCHAGADAGADPLQARAEALYRKATRVVVEGYGARGWSPGSPPAQWGGTQAERLSALHRLDQAGLRADVMLFEGGQLGRYLDLRRPLLPEDELQLARRWLTTPRTVLRATSSATGGRFTAVDLVVGTEVEIRSVDPDLHLSPGDHLLARPLPAAGTHLLLFHPGVAIDTGDIDAAVAIVTGHDGMAIAQHLLVPRDASGTDEVVCAGVMEVGDRDRLQGWMATELAPGDGDGDGDGDGGANGAGGTVQVGHSDLATLVRCDHRLTIVAEGLEEYQRLTAAVDAAAGPTERVTERGIALDVLSDEASLLNPELDKDELPLEMLKIALAEVGTEVDAGLLRGMLR